MKKLGVIGCGGRSRGLMERLTKMEKSEEILIKGGYDPASEQVDKLPGSGHVYSSYQDLVEDPEIDWVVVASPNVHHKEQILAAFAKGKHVFAEKPLATTIDDCLAIYRAHQESGLLFATGFTLRYASIYRKVKEILTNGGLGTIISVNANENIEPHHGAYIMTNWRRHKEQSGPHILEKCVHDLDLLNWFIDSLPVKVAAFGGNDMFTPENAALYQEGKEVFDKWPGDRTIDPFLSEKSIEDNVVAIMEYGNGTRVQFMASASNPIPERRMYFHCSRGNLVVELYSGTIIWKGLFDEGEPKRLDMTGGGHGDGDTFLMKGLADSILLGSPPVCSGGEGLRSAVVGLAIDEARERGEILDLRDTWKQLGL